MAKRQDRLRAKLKSDDTDVRFLLSHPMRNDKQLDNAGKPLPAKFIQDIHCWRNDQRVLTIKCSAATAANPYFAFQLVGGRIGDKIMVRWVDNAGDKGVVETFVT